MGGAAAGHSDVLPQHDVQRHVSAAGNVCAMMLERRVPQTGRAGVSGGRYVQRALRGQMPVRFVRPGAVPALDVRSRVDQHAVGRGDLGTAVHEPVPGQVQAGSARVGAHARPGAGWCALDVIGCNRYVVRAVSYTHLTLPTNREV